MSSEPRLKHVSMWKNGHGWTHITPEVAAEIFRRNVSAKENKLLCECCNQLVEFVFRTTYRSYFRHPQGRIDCEEKLSQDSFYKENKLGFSLPLKISNPEGLFFGNALKLEIGFLPLPSEKLALAQEQRAKLHISVKNSENDLVQFNISEERFSSECLTYCSIRNHVAESYALRFENINTELYRAMWPPIVRGISPTGTLFDYHTGKRLPERPFVTINKPYLLITSSSFKNKWIKKYITIRDSIGRPWHVHKLQADCYTPEAEEFFRKFGAQLSNEVSELVPFWPVSTFSSHVMRIPSDSSGIYKLLFYMSGDNILEMNDIEDGHKNELPSFSSHQGKLRGLVASDQQAILTMSRFKDHKRVLRYIVVQKNDGTSTITQTENVRVTDYNECPILEDTYDQLPPRKIIFIRSQQSDGFAETRKNGRPVSRIQLREGSEVQIPVDWNYEITIYAGLDVIRRLCFRKNKSLTLETDDRGLLQTLKQAQAEKQITISRRLGGLALHLKQYPLTRNWLLEHIRCGTISKAALQTLIRFVRDKYGRR